MNSIKPSNQLKTNVNTTQRFISPEKQLLRVQPKEFKTKELTFGQKLADSMAAKVGSWAFLIGQTTVLAGWVGANLIPGIPHWDQSPFILLNLVFSFASAYTAPIVLMSQNRQSDEDRENSARNHQVNLEAAQNLELLHEKFDELYSQKLSELVTIIKQQQTTKEIQVVLPSTQTVHPEIALVSSLRFPVEANFFLPHQTQTSNEFFKPTLKTNLDNSTSERN